MNKPYACGIILDLLPMFIEGMVSKETEQVISHHLSECEECRKTYEEMNLELDITIDKKKPTKKHKFRKKSRVRIFIYAYLLLLLSIVALCLIELSIF